MTSVFQTNIKHYNDAVIGALQYGHLEKDASYANLTFGIQGLIDYYVELEERKKELVPAGVTKERWQAFQDFEGTGATSTDSGAGPRKHKCTENSDDRPNKKPKKRGPYVTVSLKVDPNIICAQDIAQLTWRKNNDTHPIISIFARVSQAKIRSEIRSDVVRCKKDEEELRFLLGCLKAALKRAHERKLLLGDNDVAKHLNNVQNRKGGFKVIRKLCDLDSEFVTDGGDVLKKWMLLTRGKFKENIERYFEGHWVWWSDFK